MLGLRRVFQAGAVLDRVLDVAFPPVCLSCQAETQSHGLLCATCFSQLSPIAPPFCLRCAAPAASDADLDGLGHCAICAASPPVWSAARAAYTFTDVARTLIFGLKYGDRTEFARYLARGMMRHGQDVLASGDIVAPVPLHWRRLFRRKFNQAALLAHELTQLSQNAPLFVADLLRRRVNTSALAGLSPHARFQQVSDAFIVNPRHCDKIMGQRVVLIDDILTTGATLAICTQKLLDAGATEVKVMVAARSEKHDLPFAAGGNKKRYVKD